MGRRTNVKPKRGWLFKEDLEESHLGAECWDACNATPGMCGWCGERAACCRRDWPLNPVECRGLQGYFKDDVHECVAVGPDARNLYEFVEHKRAGRQLHDKELAMANAWGNVALDNGTLEAEPRRLGLFTMNGHIAADRELNRMAERFEDLYLINNSDGSPQLIRHQNLSGSEQAVNITLKKNKKHVKQFVILPQPQEGLPLNSLTAPLSDWGFGVVQQMKSLPELNEYTLRVVRNENCTISNDTSYRDYLQGLLAHPEDTRFTTLRKDIRLQCHMPVGSPFAKRLWTSTCVGYRVNFAQTDNCPFVDWDDVRHCSVASTGQLCLLGDRECGTDTADTCQKGLALFRRVDL